MEREILEDTNRLCEVAAKARDHALQETVSRRFLEKETKHVKNMGDLLQEVARVAKVPGHGICDLAWTNCGRLLTVGQGCIISIRSSV